MKRLVTWLPAILWMAVVLAMSSSAMSADNTGSILARLLVWLAPGLGPEQAQLIHGLLRKAAHLTEYGILGLLWWRAFIHAGTLGSAAAGWAALGVCVACAVADEGHQALLVSRTGSAADVMLDSLGGLAAILLARLGWWRAIELATGTLLWVAAVGGLGALTLSLAAGVRGGVLWLSVPAAALLLFYRWRRSASRA